MSLSDATRKALADLRELFEKGADAHPKLRHILITASNVDAFNEANRIAARVFPSSSRAVWRFPWKPTGEIHLLVGYGWSESRETFGRFYDASKLAVSILVRNNLLQPTKPLPDPRENCAYEGEKVYYVSEWTLFIHRFAKKRPGGLPQSTSTPYLEHYPLKFGAMVHTLEPGVFAASVLTLDRILVESLPPSLATPANDGSAESEDISPKDELGKLIHQKYIAHDHLKNIAADINLDGRWGGGWNPDRIGKELDRYAKRKDIDIQKRKSRRNRQK